MSDFIVKVQFVAGDAAIMAALEDKLSKGAFTGTAADLALSGGSTKTLLYVDNKTKDWSAEDVGLTYPATRVYNGVVWRVIWGQTTSETDIPSYTSTIWEAVGDSKPDVEEIKKILKLNISDDSFTISDKNGKILINADVEGIHTNIIKIYKDKTLYGTINAAFFDEVSSKLSSGGYSGTAADLVTAVESVAGLNSVVKKDIVDSLSSGPANNYKGQYIVCDKNGKVVFWIKENGEIVATIESATLNYQEINSTTAKVSGTNKYTKVFFEESKLAGKNILAIGDSLTAANRWQVKVAEILGAVQTTHALGGAGLLAFVDGGTTSSGTLAALTSSDVADQDAIVILGPYNNRSLMGTLGNKTDMYPTNNTLWGQMNYLFKRIYQELTNADNLQCKIFFAGVHAYGAYPYNDKTAYQEYPAGSGYTGKDFAEKLKEICGWNGIQYIDLFNNLGVNSYTWNKYQATAQPNATNYIGYLGGRGIGANDPFPDLTTLNNSIVSSGFIAGDKATVTGYTGYYTYNGTSFISTATSSYYPWVADQLHCNDAGYYLIGNYIASQINSFINN